MAKLSIAKWWQYSISLCGATSPCPRLRVLSAGAHYQKYHDRASLYSVLSTQVKAGDSMEQVTQVLGQQVPNTDSQRQGVFGVYEAYPPPSPTA